MQSPLVNKQRLIMLLCRRSAVAEELVIRLVIYAANIDLIYILMCTINLRFLFYAET